MYTTTIEPSDAKLMNFGAASASANSSFSMVAAMVSSLTKENPHSKFASGAPSAMPDALKIA